MTRSINYSYILRVIECITVGALCLDKGHNNNIWQILILYLYVFYVLIWGYWHSKDAILIQLYLMKCIELLLEFNLDFGLINHNYLLIVTNWFLWAFWYISFSLFTTRVQGPIERCLLEEDRKRRSSRCAESKRKHPNTLL